MFRRARRPIVTLTTDFGLADSYVAQMKGRLLESCPQVNIVDVTHLVPRHDVLAGSIALERAIRAFPKAIHIAVVDPGVGSSRRLLLADVGGQTVLCPDNGLITWAWRAWPGARCSEITWEPSRHFSNTFHGRDILAPVASMLATGTDWHLLATRPCEPVLLDVHFADADSRVGQIIHIDAFGNATTNIREHTVGFAETVQLDDRLIPIHRTYADVAPGEVLALIGSSDLLEIAVREGSAADVLGLRVGSIVQLVR